MEKLELSLSKRLGYMFAGLLALACVNLVSCEREEPTSNNVDTTIYHPGEQHTLHVPAHDTVFEAAGIQFNMIYVPAGTFTMGATTSAGAQGYDPDADAMESPTHLVYVDAFLIADVEVSQFLFLAVTGFNPSQQSDLTLPVHNVSFDNALRFIDSLNKITGYNFRLPTEAEWEYAAKGCGLADSNYYFAGSNSPERVGWSVNNAGGTIHGSQMLQPNALGIYDMTGNLKEWCSDWYGHYTSGSQSNPQGPERPANANLRKRVIRGGSYLQSPYYQRNTAREFLFGSSETKDIGFRIVIPVSK